jgi:formate hydrogenlyase subunit 4
MNLLNVIITLIAVGAVLWLINTLIPMDGKIKSILNAVITIVVVIWLFKVFNVAHLINGIKIGN